MCLRDRHMRRVDPSPHVFSHLEDPLSWSNSSSTISSIPLVLGGGQLRCFLRTGRMEGQVGTRALVLFGVLVLSALEACYAGETSRYVRRLAESEDLPLDSPYFAIPPGYNAPQQVHITQGDHVGEAVIVSWITPSKPGKSVVYYGKSKGDYTDKAKGKYTWYTYYNYTSGYIHHVTIRNLEYSSRYYYKIGEGSSAREFWFDTPPKVDPDAPYVFGVIGDLGQTYDSASTLEHYLQSDGKAVLFVGDLSYADNYEFDDGRRWDTWGRFVERSTAYQPWIWTAGNHEIEFNPSYGESKPYKPYSHRFKVPFKDSGSVSNLWYSIKRASAHIIVLSSYSAYAKYSPQYKWLETELQNVDRTVSPWLVVLLHSPWYNSNTYHYFEGESMRVQFEPWFVKYKVDIVFAGHVHAYERSNRISNVKYNITNGLCTPVPDESAPIYVTIGDGGNKEGLASNFTYPQPDYSAFREASFGHAIFEIKNKTHAFYSWHRNQDGEAVFADSSWLINRYWALHDAT